MSWGAKWIAGKKFRAVVPFIGHQTAREMVQPTISRRGRGVVNLVT
jgi:hypothetical protein